MKTHLILLLLLVGSAVGLHLNICGIKCTNRNHKCFPSDAEIRLFGETLNGDVFILQDPEYLNLTIMNNLLFREIPAFVVTPNIDDDIVKVIRFAKEKNMRLSVRGGGHAYDGQNVQQDSILINMKNYLKIDIHKEDSKHPYVNLGTGLIFEEIYEEVYKHNLVFNGGSCPTVGVAGWTQGGGTTAENRMLGLGVDSVLSMRVALMNTKIVTITAESEEYKDLFWALLGGGGGTYAIILEYKMKLHIPPPTFTSLSLDFVWSTSLMSDCGRSAMDFWMSIQDDIPSEWGVYVVLSSLPSNHGNDTDVPLRLSSWQNRNHRSVSKIQRQFLSSRGVSLEHDHSGLLTFHGLYWGDIEEARKSIQPLLDFKPQCQLRVIDFSDQFMPPLEVKPTFESYQSEITCSRGGGLGCRDRISNKPLFVTPEMVNDELYDLLDTVANFKTDDPSEGVGFMWTALGGAASKPNPDNSISSGFRNAFGNGAFNGYWSDRSRDDYFTGFSRTFGRHMYEIADKAAAKSNDVAYMYVNYPDTDGIHSWHNRYFGEAYERLAEIKLKYDSSNMLLKFQGVGWPVLDENAETCQNK